MNDVAVPATPPVAGLSELYKAMERCARFRAGVQELTYIPQSEGAVPTFNAVGEIGLKRIRVRGRRKGAGKSPEARPTGEYLWRINLGGGVCMLTPKEAERAVAAINGAVTHGLAAEVGRELKARSDLMVEGPLTEAECSALWHTQDALIELTQPWVSCGQPSPSAEVIVSRTQPLSFMGDRAKERAEELAVLVNSVIRPFVDPIQTALQRRVYDILRSSSMVSCR